MKEKISPRQFYALLVVYIIADDVIRGLYTHKHYNDVWIPNLIGSLISILLFTLYMFIYKNNKLDNVSNSFKHIVGKYIIKVLFLLYVIYFITISFFVTTDVNELVSIHLLPNYPMLPIVTVSLLTIGYLLYKKLEVVGRLAEILVICIFTIFIFICLFTFTLYEFKVDNILPILYDGYKPIIRPSLEMGYSVPYGELFVFVIIYENVSKREEVTKAGNLAILSSAFILTTITVFNIFILGPYAMAIGTSPALRIARTIDIEEYIQRLDLLLASFHVLLMFVKSFVLLYGAGILTKNIFNIKEKHLNLTYVIMLLITLAAIIIFEKDYTKVLVFRKNIIIRYVSLIMEVFIPFILVILSFLRKNKKQISAEEILEFSI